MSRHLDGGRCLVERLPSGKVFRVGKVTVWGAGLFLRRHGEWWQTLLVGLAVASIRPQLEHFGERMHD